jgi:hypothetical protein
MGANQEKSMPKLYEYFGLTVLFYSNEHEPVHVHGIYQGAECRASFVIENGKVISITFSSVRGRKPLDPSHEAAFRELVSEYADDIVQKWVDYFVLHKSIECQKIARRLK